MDHIAAFCAHFRPGLDSSSGNGTTTALMATPTRVTLNGECLAAGFCCWHTPDVVVLHVAHATVCQWTSGGQQQMATRMDGRIVPDSDPDGWWQSIIINVGSTSVAAFRLRFFFVLRTGLPTTTTGLWTVRRWPCHTPCLLIPLGPEPRTRPYRDVGRNLLCCSGWTLIYAEWHL